jgi:DNA-binding MarR family transcriptional regulator
VRRGQTHSRSDPAGGDSRYVAAGVEAVLGGEETAGAGTIGSPEQSPGFLLWHITLRWQRDITAALAPLDLTHVQFVLLAVTWWLNEHGENPNQLALARQAGTDVKMTSQVLARLEARELIRREVDPADTRAKRLRATERGSDLARRAITVVEAADRAFFRPVADRGQLLAVLRPLASNGTHSCRGASAEGYQADRGR